jgi:hypothetical protein
MVAPSVNATSIIVPLASRFFVRSHVGDHHDTLRATMTIFPSEVTTTATPSNSAYVVPPTRKSVGVAWLLSLFLPGSGQIFCGATIRGPAFLAVFVIALAATIFVDGDPRWLAVRVVVMTYALATYDAYETARERNFGIEPNSPDNPRVAAFLNLTTNGFGYVYLGRRWGFGVFIFMATFGRVVAMRLPLLAEILIAMLSIHAWKIAQQKRDEIYGRELRPAGQETRLPRAIPIVGAALPLAAYYLLIVVGQVSLLMNG